jgi:hypothetical protein
MIMDAVERMSGRRRTILAVYGTMFLVLQLNAFQRLDDPVAQWTALHWTTLAGYLTWAATLIVILSTGGFPFRGSAAQREAMNDELSRANRMSGYATGYWALLICVTVIFIANAIEPFPVNMAIRLAFAVGVATPAIRFAALEKRQGG